MKKHNTSLKKDNIHHLSAISHVTGQSVYIDDIAEPAGLLHGRVVYSKHAHAKILSVDVSEALKLKGVHSVATHSDIPGHNNLGPIVHDELCLAVDEVFFIGQAIVLIAAESQQICIEAEKLIRISYKVLPHITDLDEAIKKKSYLAPSRTIETGNARKTIQSSKLTLRGTLRTGGQEHWYLEPQSAMCIQDEGHYVIHSATQNPTETQIIVSEVMGVPFHSVEVNVKRLGGGFGGRETQSNHFAAWAAILSKKTRRPVKITMQRDDDQKITGKRHPFFTEYEAAFDEDGTITALDVNFHANAGCSTDLTHSIMERALFHIDNAYYIPNLRVTGYTYKTNIPSNTAFRGFGGPQSIGVIELVMDRIAQHLNLDPVLVRQKNFYQKSFNNETHYGQTITQNHAEIITKKLLKNSEYFKRKEEIDRFNLTSLYVKRGIAFTPLKFGIAFTATFLNQAGALVHIYKDGSVLVSHGGTEMGQGLHTKIAQIAAAEFGIEVSQIKIGDTNTAKVPNTSPTAASSGTDLNGMAVKNAVEKLKSRLAAVAYEHFNCQNKKGHHSERLLFENGAIICPQCNVQISFQKLVMKAYMAQTSLSATGYYKTPDIGWDKSTGKGTPFHYFSWSAAVSEVEVNTLTGRSRTLRTDIVFDAGNSINPAIDLGQIEGGFVQGLGWVTTEDMKYNKDGNLLNHSPDTYKIPGISDMPADFRIEIMDKLPNPVNIRRSKTIGEPPFMLCFSVWLAIRNAILATSPLRKDICLNVPATNEAVLLAVEELKII